MMTPDQQRIAEIRERESRATEGPWHYVPCGDKSNDCLLGAGSDGCESPPAGRLEVDEFDAVTGEYIERWVLDPVIAENMGYADYDNFRFIAHARTDIPWLLEQLAAAQAENEQLRKDAERYRQLKDRHFYKIADSFVARVDITEDGQPVDTAIDAARKVNNAH